MPVTLLNQKLLFPPVERSEPDGLLAVGGDLSIPRLELAYRSGIFPWYNEELPILWYSPNPRMVQRTEALLINRSLRKAIRKQPFTIRMDTAFREVITACSRIPRADQDGTWITDDMLEAYCNLHQYGLAHSIEAWSEDRLVGGLYGVCVGALFCGESMFSTVNNASKIAYVSLVQQLQKWGIPLVDCQVHTDHLARFGAEEWPRELFMNVLDTLLTEPTRKGKWSFDADFEIEI